MRHWIERLSDLLPQAEFGLNAIDPCVAYELQVYYGYHTMHEMSLCESVLDILEDSARLQGFERVRVVWLEIGALSGVEPEAMRFCFDAVVRNTLADQARLEIIEIPGEARCMQCSNTVRLAQRVDTCSECGSYQLRVTGGEEMKIKELEVD